MAFLSTLSLRRATSDRLPVRPRSRISIHALLAESDCLVSMPPWCDPSISIHALLAESDDSQGALYQFSRHISIHALLAESDCWGRSRRPPSGDFYPRSPCGERLKIGPKAGKESRFLSTLSLRRATTRMAWRATGPTDFYPRSPCGERPKLLDFRICRKIFLSTLSLRRATAKPDYAHKLTDISIHALLAESDGRHQFSEPVRIISIHALLAESDYSEYIYMHGHQDFYPRSPCGERP